jgi:hypothetical protein
MTMVSFRAEEPEARGLRSWAERLGLEQSRLLRDALHYYLARLESENDAAVWQKRPLTTAEESLASVSEWGPAEDWSDWDDSAR